MAHFEVSTVTAKHVNNLTVIYEQRLRARTFFPPWNSTAINFAFVRCSTMFGMVVVSAIIYMTTCRSQCSLWILDVFWLIFCNVMLPIVPARCGCLLFTAHWHRAKVLFSQTRSSKTVQSVAWDHNNSKSSLYHIKVIHLPIKW